VANIKYSELLDEVLPSLASDPSDPVTENAIKRAVIECCAGSWIWRHIPDPIDVTAGEAVYLLEPPTGSDIAVVMAAQFNTVPLDNRSTSWLDREIPGWRSIRKTPKYFTQVNPEEIILAAVPDISMTGALTMTLALQPSQRASDFPSWIFNKYIYELADGALSKLMLMPEQPWTDIRNGTDRRMRFEAAMANARGTAASAVGRAPGRVKAQH
jgi:hypothetical protein